jgi:hypothetical protein
LYRLAPPKFTDDETVVETVASGSGKRHVRVGISYATSDT